MAGNKNSGRKKAPASVKFASGTFNHRRDGVAVHPGDTALSRPDGMSPEAAELWDQVAPLLNDKRLACGLDSTALLSMCEWWSEYLDLLRSKTRTVCAIEKLAGAIDNLANAIFTAGGDTETADEVLRLTGDVLDELSTRSRHRISTMATASGEFLAFAARFGLTPADRKKIQGRPGSDPKSNPLLEMLQRKGVS